MRYGGGEVAHFSHPQHRLRLEQHLDTPFRCDGCREPGIGARFRCPVRGCDHDLHRQCAVLAVPSPLSPSSSSPPIMLRHPFYPRCAFAFLARAPGGSGRRYCNACGRGVAGYVYHCRSCGFDLHPCCASLPHALDAGGGVRLYLHPDSKVACHRCGHRGGGGWSYRSRCKSYSIHVACVTDILVENSWHGAGVGRHKVGSTGGDNVYSGELVGGSGGYVVPAIRGGAATKSCCHASSSSKGGGGSSSSSYGWGWGRKRTSSKHQKGNNKVKRCCEIAGFASQVVVSAVLGDPSALIAGVIGSLISM